MKEAPMTVLKHNILVRKITAKKLYISVNLASTIVETDHEAARILAHPHRSTAHILAHPQRSTALILVHPQRNTDRILAHPEKYSPHTRPAISPTVDTEIQPVAIADIPVTSIGPDHVR